MVERRIPNGHGVVIVVNEPDPEPAAELEAEEPAEPAAEESPAPRTPRSKRK